MKIGDLDKAQLGLGHAYSRAKVKFNVNRVDNMITQSIALLDQLDKDINTFSMRVRYLIVYIIRIVNGTDGISPNLEKSLLIIQCMQNWQN